MTNNDIQPGGPADATESMIHAQFEAAVAGLHLDVPSLVGSGAVAGRRLQRRRRLQRVGAGVASVAVIAAGGLLGLHGGLFDSNADSPANHGNVSELVPSTARGLAAAVIADLPRGVGVAGTGGVTARTQAVEADLRLTDASPPVTLAVAAIVPHLLPTGCKPLSSGLTDCQSSTLPDGTQLVTGELRPDRSSGVTGRVLILVAPSEVLFLLETQSGSGSALPLSDEQLLRIAQDPLVGLQTSQAMVDAGAELQQFRRSAIVIGAASSGSGSSGDSGTSRTMPPPVERHEPPRSPRT